MTTSIDEKDARAMVRLVAEVAHIILTEVSWLHATGWPEDLGAKAPTLSRRCRIVLNLLLEGIADLGLKMVPIPAGSFSMGNERGKKDERPVHTVTLKAFWLGQTEVIQSQWSAIMGSNPSEYPSLNSPVEKVTWGEALEFCQKLTERERNAGRISNALLRRLRLLRP